MFLMTIFYYSRISQRQFSPSRSPSCCLNPAVVCIPLFCTSPFGHFDGWNKTYKIKICIYDIVSIHFMSFLKPVLYEQDHYLQLDLWKILINKGF